ncbi:MAG: hypothetical protein WDA16_11795 [Candidatus Thermoplasmatota archaeon]
MVLRRAPLVLGAIVLVASAAIAAVLLSYTNSSTVTVTLKAPPVIWTAGPDSSGNVFVSGMAISSNATYFSITLKPVPEANVTWSNLTTVKNQDSSSVTDVTVTGTSLAAYTAYTTVARLEFYDYAAPSTIVATLDLTQASPSADLGALTAGQQLFAKAYMKVASGTGQQNIPASITLSLTVTP